MATKISNKFRRMSKIYKHFSKDWEHCLNYDDDMLLEMYKAENGEVKCRDNNGYAVGKKWLNVTVRFWKEDLAVGRLLLHELYEDDAYPHWWLNAVFKGHTTDIGGFGLVRKKDKVDNKSGRSRPLAID